MKKKDFQVTGTQCDTKWKALKKNFKKVKDNNKTSGAKRMDWEYYDVSTVLLPLLTFSCHLLLCLSLYSFVVLTLSIMGNHSNG